MTAKIIHGDCQQELLKLQPNSVDSCVTDPPYGISFLSKGWDYQVPKKLVWATIMGVLKPGAHILAFSSAKTYHRLTCEIEDAGFEVRDQLIWIYGEGFPKTHNLKGDWDGWGTALKPAHEPIVLARKPLDGTVAKNVEKHGTGAINIDGSRLPMGDEFAPMIQSSASTKVPMTTWAKMDLDDYRAKQRLAVEKQRELGRFPANVLHDGSDAATASMGDASRYFYCPKAKKKDKGPENKHPTVKPTELMKYLCKLITPPGGTVLDPFMGSGSTGVAALAEGFGFVGIEKEREYFETAANRIATH